MQNILALYGQRGRQKRHCGENLSENAALLTVAGFALRALGMVFRVFVAARLGPEGMGLYQLILSVYMVFVSLASAGINVASTRLGAQCLTRGAAWPRRCAALRQQRPYWAPPPCWRSWRWRTAGPLCPA